MRDPLYCSLRALTCVLCIGGVTACQEAKPAPAAAEAATAKTATEAAAKELAAMKADIQLLKDKAPSASVAMADVSFHWSNLWFAGQARNRDWTSGTIRPPSPPTRRAPCPSAAECRLQGGARI